jgi:hypothetical protein
MSQLQVGTYRVELFGDRGRTILNFIHVPGMRVVRPNQLKYPAINRVNLAQNVEIADIPMGWEVDSAQQDVNRNAVVSFAPQIDFSQLVLTHATTNKKISIELVFPRRLNWSYCPSLRHQYTM